MYILACVCLTVSLFTTATEIDDDDCDNKHRSTVYI